MLTRTHPFISRLTSRASQNGAALLIALIMLVAMTLAGIALVRSVDTTNVIAGNLAFQQAATHAGDKGIEAAIACLTATNTANPVLLQNDYATCGYLASWVPSPIPSWDAYWKASLDGQKVTVIPNPNPNPNQDAGGNTVSYVIQRMCQLTGDYNVPATACSFAPSSCDTSSSYRVDGVCWKPPPQVYYRITSRIVGPRNSVSYVQSIIAM